MGCLLAMLMAVGTGVMLLINGSLVLALLNRYAKDLPLWVRRPDVLQFALFCLPVLMVVVQWVLIDNLRSIFRRREYDSEG